MTKVDTSNTDPKTDPQNEPEQEVHPSSATKACPFANGCPFSGCKTREEMMAKLEDLKTDPVWGPFLEKMKGCPLMKACPVV